MTFQQRALSNVLGMIGAVVGGVVGFLIFGWVVRQGFYGLMMPAGLLGVGCGIAARHRSRIRGIFCGIAGLILGLYTEWSFFPFKADETFLYLVQNANELKGITLIMIALGTLVAYWGGKEGDIAHLERFFKPRRVEG